MCPQKIALLTDSCAALSPALGEENHIFVVPLRILCADGEYADGVDIHGADIYRRLKAGELPQTSLPSLESVGEVLEEIRGAGYDGTGEVTDSLYNFDYLTEKDKYSLFLNNIHPLIEIENKAASSQNALMLVKDSYANSIVPFLAHHYRKIYVFDTRYYRDGPSSFLSDHQDITDVLLLYNMNTLDGDTGIRGIY